MHRGRFVDCEQLLSVTWILVGTPCTFTWPGTGVSTAVIGSGSSSSSVLNSVHLLEVSEIYSELSLTILSPPSTWIITEVSF